MTLSIALVRARYNPFGGAEKFAQRAMSALAGRGAQVTVIARRWSAGGSGAADAATDGAAGGPGALPDGVRIERVDPFHVGSLWRDWSFARAVQALIAQRDFAIVQSHERIPGVAVYRAGDGVHAEYLDQRLRALPAWKAALVHADPYHAYVRHAESAMFTHPALRAVICNSEMVRGEIARRFGVAPARLHLIRNGIDLDRWRMPSPSERAAARAALGLAEGTPSIAFVGSGFERKGLAGALRGLSAAHRRDTVLFVAGTDRHARRYHRLAHSLGVNDRVRWLGGVSDVRGLLWAMDGFMLPTLYDPFPNAALEAFACGLPVITSTKSGAAELITQGRNGWVSDALDTDAIAGAIDALGDAPADSAAQRSQAARDSVAGLSLQAMADQLLGLYRSLLESAAP